jgi:septal ring factor EnvC (AmiA/AmiB activator)
VDAEAGAANVGAVRAVEAAVAQLQTGLAEMKAELTQTRTELKTELAQTRTELKTDLAEMKAEIAQTRTELKKELKLTNAKLDFTNAKLGRMETGADELNRAVVPACDRIFGNSEEAPVAVESAQPLADGGASPQNGRL